jgi:hypothetical protein
MLIKAAQEVQLGECISHSVTAEKFNAKTQSYEAL